MRVRSLIVLLVGVLSACTSGTSGTASGTSSAAPSAAAPPPGTSSAASTAGSTSRTSPSASSSSARTSAPATGTTLCTPSGSTVTVGGLEGAVGHFSLLVHVRNAAQRPCRTAGYPGVALLDGSGHQVAQAQRTPNGYMGGLRGGSPPLLVLAPGQEATALIEGLNANPDGSACATSPAFLFTLPDNTDPTRLTQQLPACQGLQVHPLLPGTTGGQG